MATTDLEKDISGVEEVVATTESKESQNITKTAKLTKKPKNTSSYNVKEGTVTNVAPSTFSTLSGEHLRLKDIYQDARTLFQKANSTKFVVVAFSLVITPLLLMGGFVSPDIFKDMTIILTLSYLGADVFERQALIKNTKKPS